MQTVILEEPGRFALGERPSLSSPQAGEALVQVKRIGVCGTDYHAYRGRQPFFSYPRVLGHELAVEVLAVGDGVTNVKPGDLCAVEPYLNCGSCVACRAGKTNCCASLKVLGVHVDGGMTEQLILPANKLHPSTTLSVDQLALVETLGIGAHAVERGQPQPGDTVLVIGAGPIGLGVALFAKDTGARVIVADTSRERLDAATALLPGIDPLLANENTTAQLEAQTNGDLASIVFDATGSAVSMRGSFDFVQPGGKLVYVGLVLDDISLPDPLFHRREMTLLATRNATAATFHHVMGLMESGAVDTTKWVTHRGPLVDVPSSLPKWAGPGSGVIKAVLNVA
jgi:2-desacetyl-2-hydroxyethyl bacteriochlorophyllide A dehydrogenase